MSVITSVFTFSLMIMFTKTKGSPVFLLVTIPLRVFCACKEETAKKRHKKADF